MRLLSEDLLSFCIVWFSCIWSIFPAGARGRVKAVATFSLQKSHIGFHSPLTAIRKNASAQFDAGRGGLSYV
jgi:hypothetical protein